MSENSREKNLFVSRKLCGLPDKVVAFFWPSSRRRFQQYFRVGTIPSDLKMSLGYSVNINRDYEGKVNIRLK